MGSRHPGALILGNQSDLAVPDRNAAGGKATVASSEHTAFTSRTQKDFSYNFNFRLSLSYRFPISVWEDMMKWFPTFLVITQGKHNIQ